MQDRRRGGRTQHKEKQKHKKEKNGSEKELGMRQTNTETLSRAARRLCSESVCRKQPAEMTIRLPDQPTEIFHGFTDSSWTKVS